VIVVGLDGSKASEKALAWAAEEARLRGATLKLVHAWHIPAMAYAAYAVPVDPSEVSKAAAKLVEDVAQRVLGDGPGLQVLKEVAEGPPAEVLVNASKGAEMVVVGSRGFGGFTGLLLGSVSAQVAHRAHCPVTIWKSGA
jgi:nucleotide-binding universal stress UspA family protein